MQLPSHEFEWHTVCCVRHLLHDGARCTWLKGVYVYNIHRRVTHTYMGTLVHTRNAHRCVWHLVHVVVCCTWMKELYVQMEERRRVTYDYLGGICTFKHAYRFTRTYTHTHELTRIVHAHTAQTGRQTDRSKHMRFKTEVLHLLRGHFKSINNTIVNKYTYIYVHISHTHARAHTHTCARAHIHTHTNLVGRDQQHQHIHEHTYPLLTRVWKTERGYVCERQREGTCVRDRERVRVWNTERGYVCVYIHAGLAPRN